MIENIFRNISTDRIHRIEGVFVINKSKFDSWIGRAAHMELVEN